MNSQNLLQDLHFDLTSSDSPHVTGPSSPHVPEPSRHRNRKEQTFRCEFLYRSLRTARWVAHSCRRQRSLSTDSYFGSESVCDKLKKSFLKPRTVTEEEMEHLRLKLAEIKIKDSEQCVENLSNIRPPLHRFRSKTVPLYNFNCEIENGCGTENSFLNEEQKDKNCHETELIKLKEELFTSNKPPVESPNEELVCKDSNFKGELDEREQKCEVDACNLVSVHSVELEKDVLLDENLNHIDPDNVTGLKNSSVDSVSQSFHLESVFPCPSDLKGQRKPSDLSPNKLVGRYENEEDYLRTQFYLMKEDFIKPLREGINDYRKQLRQGNGNPPDEVKNLKLHPNVLIIEPRIKEDKLGLAIDMGMPLSIKIGDKDFMEGSLVLITPNHFKDVFVGTVLSRKFVLPTSGGDVQWNKRPANILMVQLHDGTSHFDPTLRHRRVLLAESLAFFQPYYYVMKIFQGMAHDDLPLKEYIVGTQPSGAVACPSYLLEDTEYILGDNVKVNVMNDSSWPSREVLDVNKSQLHALKKALTEKLVLIQGPPGTGKTYLGCKVAKALLQNKHVWNKDGNRPLLLMCQTNHALDQFMELLLPMSKKVIRIGCQSKSDILAPFNIREWLRKGKKNKAAKQSAIGDLKDDLKKLSNNIQACQIELKRLASHGIVDFQTLVSMGAMKLEYARCFRDSENFLTWLEDAGDDLVSFDSNEELVQEESTLKSTGCSQHDNISTAANSQNLNAPNSSSSDLSSTLLTEASSSTMKNICIKYVLCFADYESSLKDKPSNAAEHPECEMPKLEMESKIRFFKQRLSERKKMGNGPEKADCLWRVDPNRRWVLYKSWITNLRNVIQSHLQQLETHYLSSFSAFADLKQFEKLEVMRQADVVGMTTSAAARLYPVLRELCCPIALVEEAAEVHESHIVATVTKHCQHLILLGDHKQLRPRPASYSLSRTHFTDVSLFERLVLNKTVPVNTLLTQHRMQPQISALIRPSIYEELYNHECTRNRKKILGIKKNVFFFSHQWQEKKNLLTGSYSNPQEAEMAVQLLRYLLREEYTTDEICILTAYREQLKELESNCSLYHELRGVRCLTVDNFQGEECRIVILSLVRNNPENQIGFLKIENRVCVALSRARDGLFMLGNIQLLSYNSELWMSVHNVLKANFMVGQSIPLSCRRHPQQQRNVCKPDDIPKFICRQTCFFKLACGHFCQKKCHPNDALHLKYRCQEHCERTCAAGHKCNKLCSEECGECEYLDWKHLDCGHWTMMRCSLEPSKYLCEVIVKKLMHPCLHSVNLQCWMPSLSHKYCPHLCPVMLKCGHRCPARCNALKHPSHELRCCKQENRSRVQSSKNQNQGKPHYRSERKERVK